MSEQEPQFGTDPSKLHRLDSPDTSKAAAYSVDTSKLERHVLIIISSFGARGCISDEVRSHPHMFGLPYSSVTARYKALMDKKLIVDTGERRKGQSGRGMRVMRAVDLQPEAPKPDEEIHPH